MKVVQRGRAATKKFSIRTLMNTEKHRFTQKKNKKQKTAMSFPPHPSLLTFYRFYRDAD